MVRGAHKGDFGEVKSLVYRGADVDASGRNGATALMLASQAGELDVVKFLIDKGADVGAVDKDGMTVLMHASFPENHDVVRILVEKGADVDARSNEGKTALEYFAEKKRLKDVANYLTPAIARGTSTATDEKNIDGGVTALGDWRELSSCYVIKIPAEQVNQGGAKAENWSSSVLADLVGSLKYAPAGSAFKHVLATLSGKAAGMVVGGGHRC